jgi:hypothetical protein
LRHSRCQGPGARLGGRPAARSEATGTARAGPSDVEPAGQPRNRS